MSVSKMLLLSDSMAASLALPETSLLSLSGVIANDYQLTNAIEGLEPGQYQQAFLFIGGNGLKGAETSTS